MAEQQKSTGQKAARGAQVVGGIIKIATGIASQNYAQAIIGAIEVIPWKKVFTVIGALLFLLLIPINYYRITSSTSCKLGSFGI